MKQDLAEIISFWVKAWITIIIKPKYFYSRLPKNKPIKESLVFLLAMWLLYYLFSWLFAGITNKIVTTNLMNHFTESFLNLIIWVSILYFFARRYNKEANFVNTFNIVAFAQALAPFRALELVSDNMVFYTGLSLIYLGWYYYILYSGIMKIYNLTAKNSLRITSALVIGLIAFYGIIGIGTVLFS